MNHYFNNIDIPFSIGGCNFHAVNIISSSIDTDIPLHTHGVNCYEIHFISNGCGRLIADGNEYDISTNTLYVTGPLCDHAQLTDKTSPMYEWCIYLRAEQNNSERSDILIDQFLSHNFWIGKDDQNILPIFERLFSELKSKSAGYANMAKLILSEIVVSVARNFLTVLPKPHSHLPLYTNVQALSLRNIFVRIQLGKSRRTFTSARVKHKTNTAAY